MRRLQFGLAMIALPVAAFTLFLAGCGGGKDTKSETSTGGKETGTETPTGPAKLLEAKGGVLKGKITLKDMPKVEDMTKRLRAAIDAKADQKDFCMSGPESETTEQEYRVGGNNQLGNVFVWIQPEAGTLFKVDDKRLEEAKKNPVKIRQPHCAFIPHCAIVFAEYHPDAKDPKVKKKTDQYIEVTNDADKEKGKSHNTNYAAGPKNPNGDKTLPTGDHMEIKDLVADPTPMKLKCGIHSWMDAWIRLVDTPYYAVTRSDTLDGEDKVKKDSDKFGTYEIKNLPAAKVRVFVWHERAGFLNSSGNGKEGDLVEIKEGAATEKDFEATPK